MARKLAARGGGLQLTAGPQRVGCCSCAITQCQVGALRGYQDRFRPCQRSLQLALQAGTPIGMSDGLKALWVIWRELVAAWALPVLLEAPPWVLPPTQPPLLCDYLPTFG